MSSGRKLPYLPPAAIFYSRHFLEEILGYDGWQYSIRMSNTFTSFFSCISALGSGSQVELAGMRFDPVWAHEFSQTLINCFLENKHL